jgi:hypothetical protein
MAKAHTRCCIVLLEVLVSWLLAWDTQFTWCYLSNCPPRLKIYKKRTWSTDPYPWICVRKTIWTWVYMIEEHFYQTRYDYVGLWFRTCENCNFWSRRRCTVYYLMFCYLCSVWKSGKICLEHWKWSIHSLYIVSDSEINTRYHIVWVLLWTSESD